MKLLATAVAVLATLALAAPTLGAGGKADTDVTFDPAAAGDHASNSRMHGVVDSTVKCERDRKVIVRGDNAGLIGKTRTDTYGYWSIEFPTAMFVEGVYTATVPKTSKCKEGSATRAFL